MSVNNLPEVDPYRKFRDNELRYREPGIRDLLYCRNVLQQRRCGKRLFRGGRRNRRLSGTIRGGASAKTRAPASLRLPPSTKYACSIDGAVGIVRDMREISVRPAETRLLSSLSRTCFLLPGKELATRITPSAQASVPGPRIPPRTFALRPCNPQRCGGKQVPKHYRLASAHASEVGPIQPEQFNVCSYSGFLARLIAVSLPLPGAHHR